MKEKDKPTIFNKPDWRACVLLWSPKWKDSETGVRGSAYYSANGVNNGDHAIEDDEGNKFKINRVFFNNDENLPCLQLDGGKATFKVFPKRAYMNINPKYKGLPYMTVDAYQSKVDDGTMIELEMPAIGAQAN